MKDCIALRVIMLSLWLCLALGFVAFLAVAEFANVSEGMGRVICRMPAQKRPSFTIEGFLLDFVVFSGSFLIDLQIETQATCLYKNFGIWCQIASFRAARRSDLQRCAKIGICQMIAQNLRSSQWRFVWAIGSTDCCRVDACRWVRTQAPQGGGFHPEIVGGAFAWSLPPLATRVAAKLFSLLSNVVQGEHGVQCLKIRNFGHI